MAEKQGSMKKKREHKESAGVNGGSKRMMHQAGVTIIKLKDKDGRHRGRTMTVPLNKRGLSPLDKVLLVNGGAAHHLRKTARYAPPVKGRRG